MKDNRVVNFEVLARKLDNKVLFHILSEFVSAVICFKMLWEMLYLGVCVICCCIGFFWEIRPLPGILQADRNWMAAGTQDRGTHTQKEIFNFKCTFSKLFYISVRLMTSRVPLRERNLQPKWISDATR